MIKKAHKKQRELYDKWKSGDDRAKDELLESLRGFVITQAVLLRHSGICKEDLVSEGMTAALEAIEIWDPDRGTLNGAAYYPVRNAMFQIMRSSATAAIPSKSRRDRKFRWKLPKLIAKYESLGFTQAQSIELSAIEMGEDPGLCAQFWQMRSSDDVQDHAIVSGDAHVDEVLVENEAAAKFNHQLISDLSPLERDLLMRLLDERPKSIESIGKEHGMTRGPTERMNKELMIHLRERASEIGLSPSDFGI